MWDHECKPADETDAPLTEEQAPPYGSPEDDALDDEERHDAHARY